MSQSKTNWASIVEFQIVFWLGVGQVWLIAWIFNPNIDSGFVWLLAFIYADLAASLYKIRMKK